MYHHASTAKCIRQGSQTGVSVRVWEMAEIYFNVIVQGFSFL